MIEKRHRLRLWAPLLPLLLLLAGTYWLNQQVQPLPPADDGSKRHDPDFIVSNFSATTLNKQGTPHFQISARQMVHYPDDDSTHLEDLQLSSLNADRPDMHASSKRGEISSKGDEVYLRDEVKLVRASSVAQSEMTFATPYLHVTPERELAETDQAVTVTDAHSSFSAVGMRFDNNARTIKLLAQVRSQHEIAKN